MLYAHFTNKSHLGISYLTFIFFRTPTMWSSLVLRLFFTLSSTMGEDGYYPQGAPICYSNAEGKDNIVVKLIINGTTTMNPTIIGVMYNWEVINDCRICIFLHYDSKVDIFVRSDNFGNF